MNFFDFMTLHLVPSIAHYLRVLAESNRSQVNWVNTEVTMKMPLELCKFNKLKKQI